MPDLQRCSRCCHFVDRHHLLFGELTLIHLPEDKPAKSRPIKVNQAQSRQCFIFPRMPLIHIFEKSDTAASLSVAARPPKHCLSSVTELRRMDGGWTAGDGRLCGAGFLTCGFTGLSCPVFRSAAPGHRAQAIHHRPQSHVFTGCEPDAPWESQKHGTGKSRVPADQKVGATTPVSQSRSIVLNPGQSPLGRCDPLACPARFGPGQRPASFALFSEKSE